MVHICYYISTSINILIILFAQLSQQTNGKGHITGLLGALLLMSY